jgi:flagellar protein FlaE
MGINPRDYDLDELRKMARERGGEAGGDEVDERDIGLGGEVPAADDGGGGGGGSSPGVDNSFRAGLYRELLPLEAGNDTSKPYLDSLPEHYAGENLIFEWLEFLLLHAGYQGALGAMDYYESVGWITEECGSTLNDYMLGLGEQPSNDSSDLDMDDHLLSLVYIAKLASMH